eukprot:6404145-Amphidinium_carterae.4
MTGPASKKNPEGNAAEAPTKPPAKPPSKPSNGQKDGAVPCKLYMSEKGTYQHTKTLGRCHICGSTQHFASTCPRRDTVPPSGAATDVDKKGKGAKGKEKGKGKRTTARRGGRRVCCCCGKCECCTRASFSHYVLPIDYLPSGSNWDDAKDVDMTLASGSSKAKILDNEVYNTGSLLKDDSIHACELNIVPDVGSTLDISATSLEEHVVRMKATLPPIQYAHAWGGIWEQDSKPRSMLLGAHSRRSVGVSVGLEDHLPFLKHVHAAAQCRPDSMDRAYLSVQLNAYSHLKVHKDTFNELLPTSVLAFGDFTRTLTSITLSTLKRGDALGDSLLAATVVSLMTVHHAVTSTHKKGMIKAAMVISCSCHGFGFVIPTFETFRHSGSDSWVAQLEQVDLSGLLGVRERVYETQGRCGVKPFSPTESAPGINPMLHSGNHRGRGCSGGRIRAVELTCTQGTSFCPLRHESATCAGEIQRAMPINFSWHSSRESCDNYIKGSTSTTTYGGKAV